MSKNETSRVIEVLANDLTYLPNYEQRKVKSAFWTRFSENPICEPRDITVSVVSRFVNDSRMEGWWSTPGFKEWFRNQEEFRERVESMAHLALDTLMSILITEDPKMSTARVNAAKLLLEVGRKLPSRTAPTEKYVDARIAEMDKKQLDAYIEKQLRLVGSPAESDESSNNNK